ncbi:UDP-Glycosyltransferase/glycogen phosphorylase [Aureobasidium pullulans]|uniref:UDP-Glycosyltransferase/glycogen phosphorylase n=1 Tax=Aureobasidium pullulans TaxID=5580 RepID=A0A4S9PAZ1_AURPU|nr:UDP-Glycosyltransferase/glycogen phosphorylase [Aureobasidium pullulans]THY66917.1 UDP-Glycosyltransferase/glycogen phosphorylase [Aureobasidium pullulans]THZ71959.1 UDP-Glycosyltransferase/glycogen phosphorylase [Aureobasidium pullulans]
MAEQKTPSATMAEIPSTMVAQAAAAAQATEHEDGPDPSRVAQYLNPNTTDENLPPPAYGDTYGDVSSNDGGLGTKATLRSDGRVNININQTSRHLSNLLVPALRSQLDLADTTQVPPPYIPTSLGGAPGQPPPPPLNVVIHVVGSRGDVQPFVALGKVLKEQYGHRVRLATHPVFRDFVTENGLEFFNIGGDPSELMAFMVKNPGLMPGFDVLRSGDVGKRRKEISTMIKGCWRSCIESGDGTGVAADDNTTEEWMRNTDASDKPFIADAIIANPPSFAHIHCAEKLGCPLHVMFTMPYSPTQAFPHPLANIQSTNADPHLTNFISYTLVEMLTWQGLGDVINRFRVKDLSLDPISLIWAPGMLTRLRIPHTYCWSPALIPKPKDWGNQISISGFYFLSLASNFTPPADLKAFLDAGPPPIYIGFGSIVLDDPNGMTKLIFDAVRKTGQRALVSKGWGGFGADELGIPEGVFMLGNVPHDWLFKHVSCVVHHGGAGTTAAGIACGVSTVIVPFFGDQPFWGAMVAKAGAGPDPINHKDLTADNLAEAINKALEPATRERAQDLANSISHEKGTESGAQSFHQFLEVDKLRCSIAPSKAAVWRLKRTEVRLSALAATTLATEGLLDFKDLKLYRAREYEADEGPPEPISGGAGALTGTISTMMMGVADFPVAALKALRIHPDAVPNKTKTDPQAISQSGCSGQQPSQPESSTRESAVSSPSRPSSPTRGASAGATFNLDESLAKMGSPHLTAEDKTDKEKRSRSSSLAAALQGRLGGQLRHRSCSRSGSNSRSSSPHRTNTTQSQASTQSQSQGGETNIREVIDAAFGTSKGVSRIVGAGFKSPMDFTHALAKGFHNAPKLYGDESVRKPDRITDFRSGLRAATKEFGYGMFDGITGLVTQPMEGAKKEGAAGFLKGFGKGIGGIVLKPGAAIFGIPAYTMKGVYKELQQLSGSSVQNYIIAARTAQGYDEWHRSSAQERQEIIRRWRIVESEVKKKRFIHEQFQDMLKKQWDGNGNDGQGKGSRSLLGIRPRSRANSRAARTGTQSEVSTPTVEVTQHPTEPPKYDDLQFTRGASSNDLERAIQTSVADTSRGDPEQDAMIERAIRASIAELTSGQNAPSGGENNDDEDEILRKAIAASLVDHDGQKPPAYQEASSEHDEELAAALRASMANEGHKDKRAKRQGHSTDSEWDTNSSEGDDEFRLAVKASQDQHSQHQQRDDDAELQRAISQSQEAHKEATSAEEEERVVMEYVKKQSLLEEEHRRTANKGKGKIEENNDEEDDEDLKRAMEMSLQQEGKKGGRA